MQVRVATERDVDGVTAVFTAAFAHDPLWSWAFPDPEAMAVWWRYYVRSALRYPCMRIADDYAAAAIWIPPGGTELTAEEEAGVEALVAELAGPRAPEILQLLERFETCHRAVEQPYYYLTMLGTHPDHRGKGLGMALLAACLETIDGEGAPAYLESSNAANDPRYERHGFVRVGSFMRPDGQVTVSTMWREAR
ncbi:MAG TPA: GNAT family N-acetyltransferase [Conexibacter sp.]|nr:GNAT family N-acetyltransferase [Conexibacter sp.]